MYNIWSQFKLYEYLISSYNITRRKIHRIVLHHDLFDIMIKQVNYKYKVEVKNTCFVPKCEWFLYSSLMKSKNKTNNYLIIS